MARRRWRAHRMRGCVYTHCPPASGCTGCNPKTCSVASAVSDSFHPWTAAPQASSCPRDCPAKNAGEGLPCQDRVLMRHTRGEKQRQRAKPRQEQTQTGGGGKGPSIPKRITRNAGPGSDTLTVLSYLPASSRLETNPQNDRHVILAESTSVSVPIQRWRHSLYTF